MDTATQDRATSQRAATCAACGATAAGESPFGWTRQVTRRGPAGTQWVCPACTRAHIRSIEGYLEPGDW